jgi:hypothetical protein
VTDDACENDVCPSRSLPGFNLGRHVCLFRSKFLFLCCLLIPVSFSISCQDMGKKNLYNTGQVLTDEFVWPFDKKFFGKNPYISVFWKVNFVASFGINTKAGIVCELNASVCSRFNQFCQLFSINIASVFILVKFNTVYDSFSHWKALFLTCPTFLQVFCDRTSKIDWVFTVLSAFILLSSHVFVILNTYYYNFSSGSMKV